MSDEPAAPQFGRPEPGVAYRDRPAAFGIAEDDGRIAIVKVTAEGLRPWFDLPGGAIDPGETAADAVVREFGEETGLVIEAGAQFGRADQRFRLADGEAVNNRCSLFHVRITGLDAALKIEQDHELVWFKPARALPLLRHDAHAWAVTAWLRRQPLDPPPPGD